MAAGGNAVNVIVVGMAGSGKTTLISSLSELRECYLVNLDPACNDPPYPVDVDIRDTVSYKDVMREYNLGPNGAIVTSLNLYSTKIHQTWSGAPGLTRRRRARRSTGGWRTTRRTSRR